MKMKIVDIYRTRYFYLTYKKDLTYLFESYLSLKNNSALELHAGSEAMKQVFDAAKRGEEVEFDLAGAHITPDIVECLNYYTSRGVKVVDSTDTVRDEILAVNRERYAVDTSKFTPLPEFTVNTNIKEYLKELRTDCVYLLTNGQDDVYIPLACIICIVRPTVQLCLGSATGDVFTYLSTRLTFADIMDYTEYYYTTPEGTRIIKFNSVGKTNTQRLGYVDKLDAATVGNLIPTVFGREKLNKIGCWRNILSECLKQLERFKGTRKPTIYELFGQEATQ